MQNPINLQLYIDNPNSNESIEECRRLARLMHEMGAVSILDPRVTEHDNNVFLDVLESYFNRPSEDLLKDARPDLGFQIGVTPEGKELPRCTSDPRCQQIIEQYSEQHKPHVPQGYDAKWRFFHRIGDTPTETKFPSLNEPPVQPEGFPNWVQILDTWGYKLLDAAFTLAEMLAIGLGLQKDAFTNLMINGPHLLAPTASDLNRHGLGTILAGFHQDLNFMTFHGKSRYSGLSIWLRDGTKMPVSIPNGCLLVQAGMEVEHLTGGYIKAGYHEVVVNEKTVEQVERARQEGRPLWRISSTLFSHVASDNTLTVLYPLDEEEREAAKLNYADILAGDHVSNELKFIKLL